MLNEEYYVLMEEFYLDTLSFFDETEKPYDDYLKQQGGNNSQ